MIHVKQENLKRFMINDYMMFLSLIWLHKCIEIIVNINIFIFYRLKDWLADELLRQ